MPCRNAVQKQIRSGHASFVAKRLQKLLNSEPELNRMHSTNRILPAGSLKQRSVRRLFAGWIRKFSGKGRFFTRSLAQQICWRIRNFFSMEPSIPSGEIERMRGMLQTARKRKLGPHSGKKKPWLLIRTIWRPNLCMVWRRVSMFLQSCCLSLLFLSKVGIVMPTPFHGQVAADIGATNQDQIDQCLGSCKSSLLGKS